MILKALHNLYNAFKVDLCINGLPVHETFNIISNMLTAL